MNTLEIEFKPVDWLFIDSSKVRWKNVLLHNENRFSHVPLAHGDSHFKSWNARILFFVLEIKVS